MQLINIEGCQTGGGVTSGPPPKKARKNPNSRPIRKQCELLHGQSKNVKKEQNLMWSVELFFTRQRVSEKAKNVKFGRKKAKLATLGRGQFQPVAAFNVIN